MNCIAGLDLTQEQINKLLIMAKAFFPNLQNEAISKSIKHYGNMMIVEENLCGFHVTRSGLVQCSYPYLTSNHNEQHFLTVRIHWFEFCLRILCPIILDSVLELYEPNGYTLSGHPVDLLYNRYGRLYSNDIRYLATLVEEGRLI